MDKKYSSMFTLFANTSNKQNANLKERYVGQMVTETTTQNVDSVRRLLNEIAEEPINNLAESVVNVKSKESYSSLNDFDSFISNINQQNSNAGKIKRYLENMKKKEFFDQIESVQCLFTWNLKPLSKNIITSIENKYGVDNLDLVKYLPTSGFTFVRFIGNLIISYELYQKGKLNASHKKILDISNWLERFDNCNDEFYISIKSGLKHIKTANFIHMLFISNENEGLKQLLNEIVPFDKMSNKTKASVYAIRAIILIEYSEDLDYFKNACQYADDACALDPKTSHWFHIYAYVLIAQRQFLIVHKTRYTTDKLRTIENEIHLAIRRAVMSLDMKHTHSLDSLFNQLLTNIIQTNLNESTVLKQTVNSKYNSEKSLIKDVKLLIEYYKKGNDPIPYLNDMVNKYNGYNRLKIMAQICSYTILFTNNLKNGVKQLLLLIEEAELYSNDFIINHNSVFIESSQTFNLAVLTCNEIKLALTNFNCVPFDDILFYYKMIFKIEETYDLKIKAINRFMKHTLINDYLVRSSQKIQKTLTNNSLNDNFEKNFSTKCTTQEVNLVKPNKTDLIDFKVPNLSPFMNESFYNPNYMSPENSIYFKIQTGTLQYVTSQNNTSNPQKQDNFYNNNYQHSQSYLNQNYNSLNSFGTHQHYSNIKLDVSLQSTMYTNDVITTNVTSDSMIIDTSLHNLPKSSSKTIYKNYLNIILENYPNSYRIYTDASKHNNNVGIAIVTENNNYCYKLSSEYTSSEAEAVAILRALDYALAEHVYDFVILSDSLSTLKCIQNLNTDSSDVIKSIVCLLHAHKLKGNKVQFIWVPSHNEIEGNEKADKLAKKVASSKTEIIYSHNSFKIRNFK